MGNPRTATQAHTAQAKAAAQAYAFFQANATAQLYLEADVVTKYTNVHFPKDNFASSHFPIIGGPINTFSNGLSPNPRFFDLAAQTPPLVQTELGETGDLDNNYRMFMLPGIWK